MVTLSEGVSAVCLNEDCDRLNRTYGAPGRIVFRPSNHGTPIVALANQYGSCEVALLGAQTLSYRPTGNLPVLYLPLPYDTLPIGEEKHGGIPVCWPWFARNGAPGSRCHGLARYQGWGVKASEYSEDATEITLSLSSNEVTRALWPHDFELELKISLSMKLTLDLKVRNSGRETFSTTEGFHPYLAVREAATCKVLGVDSCPFADTRAPEKGDGRIWTGDCPIEPGSKIFTVTTREWALLDEGCHRAIAMVSRGNDQLVVWNPGPFKTGDFKNLPPEAASRFACVEPATLPPRQVTLAPGEEHRLTMAVQSVPDGGSVHARSAS